MKHADNPQNYYTDPENTPDEPEFDLVTAISRYEEDELETPEIESLFQRLVDTGLAWSLQGHYGRTAQALIDEGRISGTELPRSIEDAEQDRYDHDEHFGRKP